ncbi:PASTA domain-containing protein [Williamwhitmania taraxaci]|uniref:PASTA domain-containing protein n=1 Tax=Williamwhitmania taraxaci TaxID=1640674 RepID=A0A1G6JHZ2_9BACT|nr:PASTA domain-containing protein [Williamwhitmania taraxaci]SDC18350.1 PASTA domain-containing protein [Williamwhitmania taraxaci]
MDFKEYIKKSAKAALENFYVKNVLYAFAGIIILLLLTIIVLNIFTRHGRTYPVPNLSGLTVEQANELTNRGDFRLTVSDSVYIDNRTRGVIVDQNPKPETDVKSKRRIFLTINAVIPVMVPMPNLIDLSNRQAKAILEQQGLRISKLSYAPDIAANSVLTQKIKGISVRPGTKVPRGSKVELVLGLGSNPQTGVPLLIGQSTEEAQSRIFESSLNIGTVKYDESVKNYTDSLNAKVYNQYPTATSSPSFLFGSKVSIWLTINNSRISTEGAIKTNDAAPKDSTEDEDLNANF